MKRMIVFLLTAVLLLATKFTTSTAPNFEEFDAASSVLIVCDQDNEKDYVFQTGDDYYYFYEDEKALYVLENLNLFEGVKGLNIYFPVETPLSYFQERLDYLGDKTEVEGKAVYYGYYKGYSDFEYIDGKKINVQLAESGEGWVAGFPMILSGF